MPRQERSSDVRALIVSLNTYSSPFNDQKLVELGRRLESVTAVAGEVSTMWDTEPEDRCGNGFQVRVLKTRLHRSNATTLLRDLGEVARDARPTVLHVECEPWQGVAVQSVSLARRLGIPVGVQFAENGPQLRGPRGALRRLVGKRVLKSCRYAIGWSQESTEIARQLAPGIRAETYPGTGITMSIENTPSSECRERWFGRGLDGACAKVAFVGRFSPEKGLEEFFDVVDQLSTRIPVRVALAGGAPSHPMARAWLASHPDALAHGVLERSQVSELLATADVLVCPSRTTRVVKEQFGKAPVEAMAVGTPVFAFDCGALREVIGSGGVVVKEGDSRALVNELERYFSAPDSVRAALVQRARAQASRFTDAALAEALIQLWSDSLAREPAEL